MYCKNCGQKIPDSSMFCDMCGTKQRKDAQQQISQTNEVIKKQPRERKKLSGKTKAIISICTVFVIIIGIAVTGLVVYFKSPAREVIGQLSDGEYEEALDTYKRDVSENFIYDSLFKFLIESKLDDKMHDYLNGTLKYDEALPYLSAIVSMGVIDGAKAQLAETVTSRCESVLSAYSDGTLSLEAAEDELIFTKEYESLLGITTATEQHDTVVALADSKKNFETAESCYESGDYGDAITYYGMVSEESTYFDQAQSMIASATQSYKDQMIAEAQARYAKSDYAGALSIIEHALALLSDDSELMSLRGQYQSDYEKSIEVEALSNSTTLQSSGDYKQAISVLAEALELLPDSSELSAAYDACVNEYVIRTCDEADEHIERKDFRAAMAVINEALSYLGVNATLSQKLASIEDQMPVSITEVLLINYSNSWGATVEWNSGLPEDPFGNDYSDSANFAIFPGYDHAFEYRIYGEYSQLSLIVAPYSDISSDARGYIQIYADDRLLYTSKNIDRKTDAFSVNVDITGADYITIKVIGDSEGSLILSDVLLWK